MTDPAESSGSPGAADRDVPVGEVGVVTGPRGGRATAVRVLALLVVLVFAGLSLRSAWSDVRADLARLTVPAITASALAFGAAIACQFAAWFGLLHRHARANTFGMHDGAVVYSVGQLGKYVPGAVWPAVIQSDMGARRRMPWRVMLGAYTQMLVLSVTTGAVLGLGTLLGPAPPWVHAVAIAGAVAGVVFGWAAVHPDALHRWMDRVLQRLTAAGLPERLDGRAAARAAALSIVAWLLIGAHAVAIVRPLGVTAGDALFVGASFVFAWVCGIVAVPFPAGLGIREAVLIVTVGQLTDRPTAVALALASRLIQVVVDLGLAGVLGALGPVLRRRLPATDPS
jgi:hypothetical protein